MKAIKVLAVSAAGLSAVVAVVAGQVGSVAADSRFMAEAVADAKGNLRVPDAYRTTYEFLGTWAVATDQGQGSQELHVVYASPGTITARLSQGRRFSWHSARERGAPGGHWADDNRHCRADGLRGSFVNPHHSLGASVSPEGIPEGENAEKYQHPGQKDADETHHRSGQSMRIRSRCCAVNRPSASKS